jgi:mono/diheme cytochrome c family protein
MMGRLRCIGCKRSFYIVIGVLVIALKIEASPGHPHVHEDDGSWVAPFVEALKNNPIETNENSIRKGKSIYNKHCSQCHGINGSKEYISGKQKLALREIVSQREDGDLAWKITSGRGEMPSWDARLSKEEIWHIVNYLQRGLL